MQKTNEIWKDVVEYDGKYQVSNLGNVRSFSKFKKGDELKQYNPSRNPYLYVCLHKNNKQKHTRIHRLVAEAFMPNPEEKEQVHHINRVVTDNRLDNLAWVTQSENMRYSAENILFSKINYKIAGEIRDLRESGVSRLDVAERFSLSPTNITDITKNRIWLKEYELTPPTTNERKEV